MKNISENYQFRTFDPELGDKNKLGNNPIFYAGNILPSSKGEINFDKNNILNSQSLNITTSSNNSTSTYSQNNNNTSSLSLKNNEYYLYGNDFVINSKPYKLGKTRVCLYIKKYPIISFGKNILYPLLLILMISCLYLIIWLLFFNEAGILLKKLFNYFFISYLISHILSIFINPGIPSFKYSQILKYNLKEKKINKLSCSKCKKCKLYYKLKDNIGHCNNCDICYRGYERHSFWIGHCIGKYNKFFFICFVISLWTFIMLCLAMIVVKILKAFFIKQT